MRGGENQKGNFNVVMFLSFFLSFFLYLFANRSTETKISAIDVLLLSYPFLKISIWKVLGEICSINYPECQKEVSEVGGVGISVIDVLLIVPNFQSTSQNNIPPFYLLLLSPSPFRPPS